MVCCVTGHRPQGFPFARDENERKYARYTDLLYDELRRLTLAGYDQFITGLAEGADVDFGELVLYLRDVEHLNVKLEVALPYEIALQKAMKAYSARRYSVLERCDSITAVSPKYFRGCMHKRNRYMVDKADIVLGIWNGRTSGGTWSTIQYARTKNKPIKYIMLCEI